ncbi:MAG: hypothetical protein Q8Q59_15640 [Luteolibacter sp.]|nr:hypothetical protein [Luteolibacter sp.]
MKTTVFTSGGAQAVRTPKELRIDAKRVEIERKGSTLVLRPLPDENTWPEGYLDSFAAGRLDEGFVRHAQGEARVRQDLASAGQTFGALDILIAGHALEHHLTLVTGNTRGFSCERGLRLETWGM